MNSSQLNPLSPLFLPPLLFWVSHCPLVAGWGGVSPGCPPSLCWEPSPHDLG